MSTDDKPSHKRLRDESDESEFDSPEVKRIKEQLLGALDEPDPDDETQDLESVLKSFQNEISTSPSPEVIDLTSDAGESQPELGFLLGASDDELGLPPSSINSEERFDVSELVKVDSGESVGIGELWGFGDEIPRYDSFEFGFVGNDYVAFDDGLFEHSNVYNEAYDVL